MPDDKLTPLQRAALLVLMAEGRKLSNSEFEEIADFRLDGADRRTLNRMGWVETDTTVRPFVHELTKEGRDRCVEELRTQAPQRAGSPLVGALYAVLAGLDRHMQRTGTSLSTIFSARVEVEVADKKSTPEDAEALARHAYRSLVREPNGWVSLADLPANLPDVSPAAIDAALKKMVRQSGVTLIPEADQSSLKQRDRDAAVRIGGEFKHALKIEGR